MKNDTDDVSFSDGLSYMVGKNDFGLYMNAVGGLPNRRAAKKKEKSVCVILLPANPLVLSQPIG